jgi:tetratricopeptide (TPR) repeat protein
MKKILPIKLMVLFLFFLSVPCSQAVLAQDEEGIEADWTEDAEDETPTQPAPVKQTTPAPVKNVTPAPAPTPAPATPATTYNSTSSSYSTTSNPPPVSSQKSSFEPITPPQSSYTVGSTVKRAGSPLVLITRPVFAPYSNEDKTMFISAVAESYFHFKLGAVPGFQVLSVERIANSIQYFRDFSRRISRSSYIETAKKIGAGYLFYQEYEPKGKKVKFAIELYSIAENKKLTSRVTEISLADFENGLYDFVSEVAGSMAGTLSKETQEFLATPVIGTNERQIELLGNAIVSVGESSKKSAEKAAPEFEKLAKDRVMHLAKYAGAQTMAVAGQYDKAIALQQQLISTFGKQCPVLYLELASYYRQQGSFSDALQAVEEAVGEPSLKFQSRVEKARIHEADGKLNEAKREYESVLSDGGEDGEIYFQLALVNIGLRNLQQAERYLEKAAAAGRELDRGAYFDLGLRYSALGSANDEAIKAFRNCLGLQQDNEAAWQKLAEIYSAAGREAEAAECYVSLFQINNTTYKDYLLKAGIMYEQAGDQAKAKDAYSLFIARRFTNPEVSVRLAKLEAQSGNCQKAIELVDNIDTTGEFGQDVSSINTQCNKEVRRVVVPTGNGRDKNWQAVFFWRVASGVITVAGAGLGYMFDVSAKQKHKQYYEATNIPDMLKYRKEFTSAQQFRTICYAGAGIGGVSLILSIPLPIVLSNK